MKNILLLCLFLIVTVTIASVVRDQSRSIDSDDAKTQKVDTPSTVVKSPKVYNQPELTTGNDNKLVIPEDGASSEAPGESAISAMPEEQLQPEGDIPPPPSDPQVETLDELSPERIDELKRYNYPLYLELLANSSKEKRQLSETPEEAELQAVEGALSILSEQDEKNSADADQNELFDPKAIILP